MHHPTDRITHTTAFVTPVVEHWLEREIAQWVHLWVWSVFCFIFIVVSIPGSGTFFKITEPIYHYSSFNKVDLVRLTDLITK